ncbi:TetR/AcrR family transcriptional regulator [Exilibacterium tricleocarpae]|uniref:TetR/AcrR family transcriptional regulator n=1 Tax=Exilibacterium tricleocarpae TaxID=2591008 RepID=UPI0015D372FD|nr:TetR/AcrR family transcriptional regulator [Exilibacterium tricleocarpae]
MTGSKQQLSKGEARRALILAAARKSLLADGYANVSVRMIASSLGISVGNLQYYFPTKDSLIQAVIADETERPIELLSEINWRHESAEQCIAEAVASILQYYASEAGQFYAIAEFLAMNDPSYSELKAQGYAYVRGYVRQVIDIVAPHLDTGRQDNLAQVLVALIDGASLQVQLAKYGDKGFDIDALIKNVVDSVRILLDRWE